MIFMKTGLSHFLEFLFLFFFCFLDEIKLQITLYRKNSILRYVFLTCLSQCHKRISVTCTCVQQQRQIMFIRCFDEVSINETLRNEENYFTVKYFANTLTISFYIEENFQKKKRFHAVLIKRMIYTVIGRVFCFFQQH